jgi:hypothetical protein
MTKRARQNRERGTGRYAFDGEFDRLCECGHTLGVHTAERGRDFESGRMMQECINHDVGDGTLCNCVCFKPAKSPAGVAPIPSEMTTQQIAVVAALGEALSKGPPQVTGVVSGRWSSKGPNIAASPGDARAQAIATILALIAEHKITLAELGPLDFSAPDIRPEDKK